MPEVSSNAELVDELEREPLQNRHPTQIPNAEITDQLGKIHALRKSLEDQEKILKDEIKRRGGHRYEGNDFLILVNERTRSSLDRNAVLDRLGQAWVDRHTNHTSYREVVIRSLHE